ncbi:MAG: hypothetical protein P4L50_12520 [Anaerolineaceae bacterium]|nr:hypothetical protein [Anaerolineaceae bacterium]
MARSEVFSQGLRTGMSMVRSNKPTTPEDFPTQSPLQPSGDYSYTLEIVMQMKESMGRLLEAVDGLKTDSREHRAELKTISQEIHGFKVGARWVIAVCLGFGALIGWAVTTYISVIQSAARK